MAKAFRSGFVYTGQYSPVRGRLTATARARRGQPTGGFLQNHDQIGNRMLGERLGSLFV